VRWRFLGLMSSVSSWGENGAFVGAKPESSASDAISNLDSESAVPTSDQKRCSSVVSGSRTYKIVGGKPRTLLIIQCPFNKRLRSSRLYFLLLIY
jgi:hypothetical protein